MILLRAKAERNCTALILICLFYWARRLTGSPSPDFGVSRFRHRIPINVLKLRSQLQGNDPGGTEPAYPAEFPKNIWQTSTHSDQAKWEVSSSTWSDLNPDWSYHYLSDETATSFVHKEFQDRASIVHFWDSLANPILRADLLRYLVLLAKGGVYSDIDTTALAPISEWIPGDLTDQVNAVVGIEYDDKPGSWAIKPIGFCQWTLMAKPGHPLFERVVQRVISNLEFAARLQRVELSLLELDFSEVLAGTGPGLMSDVLIDVVRDQMRAPQFDWASFHDLREPTLFGDILILPINGFAGNQKHSHSGDPAYGEKLVQHHFGRSWYLRDQQNARKKVGKQRNR
jgi:alpha 1,6-mannosyltransferase